MALTTPILFSVAAFDATEKQNFVFNVVGGAQVVSNKLSVVNQTTGLEVYAESETTYNFLHELPADTLENGEYYSATLTTFDANGTESSSSNAIQFYCYETPQFEFNNIPLTGIIPNASYGFEIIYDQAQDELLSTYSMTLYDAQRIAIATSETQFVGDVDELPLIVSYVFSGLTDKESYFIQAQGQTAEGTQLNTGLVPINVQFEQPNIFSIIELTNKCQGGYVVVKSNLVGIDGKSVPSPPVYVDENTAVDATAEGHYINWDSGYNLTGDFTASLWGRDFNTNAAIIKMQNNEGDELVVGYCDYGDGKVYAALLVHNNGVFYHIYSQPIDAPSAGDNMQIWFRRIGTLYEIGLYNLADT